MYSNILYPVDVSEKAEWEASLPVAIEHAKRFDATLHVMMVLPDFGMSVVSQYFPKGAEEKMLEEGKETLTKFAAEHIPSDVDVELMVRQGTVYQRICEAADKVVADLIIMSAHRPELKDYLLGPNAAKVVRHAKTSVLVIRER